MIRLVLSVLIVAVFVTVVILPFMKKIRKQAKKTAKQIDNVLTSDVSEKEEK